MPAAAAKKLLIQDAAVTINTGTDALPVWTEIEGVNSVGLERTVSEVDLTDFNSGAHRERFANRREWSITVGGFYMEDVADGARPVGQGAVEAVADLLGAAAEKTYRIVLPSGKGKQGRGFAAVTGPGGGVDDGASWGFTVTSTGALSNIA